jgi:hypothetical protein
MASKLGPRDKILSDCAKINPLIQLVWYNIKLLPLHLG